MNYRSNHLEGLTQIPMAKGKREATGRITRPISPSTYELEARFKRFRITKDYGRWQVL